MWKLIFYLVLNALLLVYFWRKPKTLTPDEIAGCWLLTMIFGDDWLTIVSDNLHLIETIKVLSLGLTFTLNQIVLFRIVAVLFLDWYVRQRSKSQKINVFFLWTCTFLLLQELSVRMGFFITPVGNFGGQFRSGLSTLYEWLADQAHVFAYKGWHLYFSTLAYVILIWLNTFFLIHLQKWVGRAEG